MSATRAESSERLGATQDALRAEEAELAKIENRLKGLLDPQILNEDLSRYLGHRAIQFESHPEGQSEAGYRIARADGRSVERLSEGESTAIALLYFLRGLREAPDQPDIVVIDDPVTSLDDSGVFTAHSFIKEAVIRNHGQPGPSVVITTHNHNYFRLLVDWHGALNRDDRERALLLETAAYIDADSLTTCRLREMPDEIAHAGSEYAVLVSHLVEFAGSRPTAEEPFSLYIAPNVARRVLEAFLTFKFGGRRRSMMADLLVMAFNDPKLESFGAERRERLHRLLNTSAHGSGLTDAFHTIASRTEIAMVVSDVIELIRSLDSDHLERFES